MCTQETGDSHNSQSSSTDTGTSTPAHSTLNGPQSEKMESIKHNPQSVTEIEAMRKMGSAESNHCDGSVGRDRVGVSHDMWRERVVTTTLPLLTPGLSQDARLTTQLHSLQCNASPLAPGPALDRQLSRGLQSQVCRIVNIVFKVLSTLYASRIRQVLSSNKET